MELIIAIGIPSTLLAAVFCFLFRRIEKRMERREEKEKGREKAQEELMELVIESTAAAISLGEATAISIKRLDKECNGEMELALEYARDVKKRQRKFLRKEAVGAIL